MLKKQNSLKTLSSSSWSMVSGAGNNNAPPPYLPPIPPPSPPIIPIDFTIGPNKNLTTSTSYVIPNTNAVVTIYDTYNIPTGGNTVGVYVTIPF